jgi:Alginate export
MQGIATSMLLAGVLAVPTLCAAPARATDAGWQDHVTLILSDRMRGEFADWFEPAAGKAPDGANRYDFFANQLRFGLQLKVPYLTFTVVGQDTRLVNLPSDASPPASKVGNLGPGALYFANTHDRDQGETFLKLGYVTVKDASGAAGLSFAGGRFEYSDGLETVPANPTLAWLKRNRISQRLVGPFGYTHVTRSFDGAELAYDTSDFNVTALGTRPTMGGFEVSANRELDIWLAGLALTLKRIPNLVPIDARIFYLYYRDNRDDALKVDNRSAAARSADRRDIEVHTWGAHGLTVVDAGPGRVDGLIWAAIQGGDWGKLDHFGWAYALETGYQLPKLPAAPWLRIGYNRSSGDDNPNDHTHETFFQILPTARIYAQFPFFNMMNTEDLFGQLILQPHERVNVRADYHWLRLTESADLWYAGGGATSDTFFGYAGSPSGGHHELSHLVDLALTVSLTKQLSAYAYYGHAFGQGVVSSNFAGTGADYGYIELTLRY